MAKAAVVFHSVCGNVYQMASCLTEALRGCGIEADPFRRGCDRLRCAIFRVPHLFRRGVCPDETVHGFILRSVGAGQACRHVFCLLHIFRNSVRRHPDVSPVHECFCPAYGHAADRRTMQLGRRAPAGLRPGTYFGSHIPDTDE